MRDLERFIQAQAYNYEDALQEMQNGRKQSCWMWYELPQIHGLGLSHMAKEYELDSIEEAKAYLAHPVLGQRLLEMCEVVLHVSSDNAQLVFGVPDNLKLRSSMTLFEQADPQQPIFGQVLDKFFHGERDERTLKILREDEKR